MITFDFLNKIGLVRFFLHRIYRLLAHFIIPQNNYFNNFIKTRGFHSISGMGWIKTWCSLLEARWTSSISFLYTLFHFYQMYCFEPQNTTKYLTWLLRWPRTYFLKEIFSDDETNKSRQGQDLDCRMGVKMQSSFVLLWWPLKH